jgi:hypothetical protein
MKSLFQAPCSSFNPTFWEQLYSLKLNVMKLDSTELPISSQTTCSDGTHYESVRFSSDSFSESNNSFKGALLNVNTVEVC